MTALSYASPGQNYKIKWNVGNSAKALEEIGIAPGKMVYLLSSYFGSVILRVNGKTIALDRDAAFAIKVG